MNDADVDELLDDVLANDEVSGDDYPPDPDDEDTSPRPQATQIRQRIMQRHQVQTMTPKQVKRGDRLIAMEKRRKALELRKGGATYEQIAKATGYSQASSARKAVVKALGDVIQEPALEVKTIQIERLNHMLLTLWPKIQQGDERAIDTGLRVMDKIDRLMGTEMAKQVDINVNHQDAILVIGGNKDDYIAAMKRMVGVNADGRNTAIEAGPAAYPIGGNTPLDVDVVDAEVVGMNDDPGDETDLAAKVRELTTNPIPPAKKYRFSMDPTVNREKK